MTFRNLSAFGSSYATDQSTPSPVLPTGRIKLMQEIPYDVWRCIADFLPVEQVKGMYSVNRSLLNISLDERYRVGYIGSLYDEVAERNFMRLSDPEISPRVSEFIFKPGHLFRLLYIERLRADLGAPPEHTVTTELLNAFKGMKITSQKNQAQSSRRYARGAHITALSAYRNVLRMFQQMTRLTTLRIEFQTDYQYFQQASIPLFAIGWVAFGSSLRSLDLRIPLEAMEKVLPSSYGVTLTNLHALSLQIIRTSLADPSVILMEKFLPFIIAHRSRLRYLSLDVAEQMNLSPFLLKLEPMMSLQSFKLTHPFVAHDQMDLTGLKHFLQKHRSHLIEFDLGMLAKFAHYPIPYAFFAQPCFGVNFPNLRRLSIHFSDFPPQYSEGLIPYILQFKTTLVSLAISERPWTLQRLRLLLKDFSSDSPLRELKVSILVLNSDVIEVLSTSLCNLDALDIQFERIGPDGYADPPINTIPLFANELRGINLSEWNLRDLRISPFPVGHGSKMSCKRALVDALPNVQRFCGLTPQEYLTNEIYVVECMGGRLYI